MAAIGVLSLVVLRSNMNSMLFKLGMGLGTRLTKNGCRAVEISLVNLKSHDTQLWSLNI